MDEGLLPSQTYTYTARVQSPIPSWMDGNLTSQVQVRTMDTTSHDIQWYVDTLGSLGVIRNVWVFSSDLTYAVGEIRHNNTTFNVAKWNGQAQT